MLLRTILLVALSVGLGWIGLMNACTMQLIEVRIWDGYKLSLPPWMSDKDIVAWLREHDAVADRVILASSNQYLPPSLRPSVESRIAHARAKIDASSWRFTTMCRCGM
jgi:hypothetical protein